MSGARPTRAAKPAPAIDFGGLGLPARTDPPPRPAAAPAPEAAPAVRPQPPAVTQQPPAAAAKPRKRRRSVPSAASGTGVYLPVSLVQRLRTYARAHDGSTYTDIALDAIESAHPRLTELVAPAEPRRSGPLFAGRVAKRSAHDEPHQQVNLRFSAEDLAVVDALVAEVAAPNRSALLAAALQDYLP